MKSSVSWAYQCRKMLVTKIQRALLSVLHHSFPQIWFAQTDGEDPLPRRRVREEFADLRRYGNVAVYVVRDVPIFTPPNSTTGGRRANQFDFAGPHSSLREKRPEMPMRAKSIFARTFKLIGPSGPFCKNSSISYFPKLCLRLRIPRRQEGRTRRHERGAGTRWT